MSSLRPPTASGTRPAAGWRIAAARAASLLTVLASLGAALLTRAQAIIGARLVALAAARRCNVDPIPTANRVA